jgi:hypothetical protein
VAIKWTAVEVEQVQAALSAGPAHARAMPPSPRGTLPSGAGDYRGFPLTELRGVIIVDVDFTGARAPKNAVGVDTSVQLQEVVATRCAFDRVGKVHRLAGQYTACSFRGLSTRSCSVRGTFVDCDFTGANFKGAHFSAHFLRCRFDDANLQLASWPSSFRDCTFAGAEIQPIFSDVRAAAFAGERVTFTVTMSAVKTGEAP